MTTVILNAAKTDKLIDMIQKRGAQLDSFIHQAAISAVDHHVKHGDTTLVNRLILAMPKSGRKNALVQWVLHFDLSLALNDDKATKATQPLVHVKVESGFDVVAADAKPFWDFKAQEGVAFTFDAYLATLTKGLNKALTQDLSAEQRVKLQAALAALV